MGKRSDHEIIDVEKWERSESFDYFIKNVTVLHYSAELDVSNFVKAKTERGLKFFASVLYFGNTRVPYNAHKVGRNRRTDTRAVQFVEMQSRGDEQDVE